MYMRTFKVWARSADDKESETVKGMSDIKEKLGTPHWNKGGDVLRARPYPSKTSS